MQGATHASDMSRFPRCDWPDAYVRTARSSSPPIRSAAAGTRRGSGNLARMPLSLHVLREGQLPRQVPPPACTGGLGRSGRPASRKASSTSTSSTKSFSRTRNCWKAWRSARIKIGVQTRIDLWSEAMIDLLGRAGCVSIEAGVEIITEEGRAELDKKCKMSTEELADTTDLRQAARALRPGQPDRDGAGRLGCGGAVPRASHAAWRLGEQARAAVSVSRLARLHEAMGSSRTTEHGNARIDYYLTLYDQFSDIQDSAPCR